jgi:hypothetical protein
MTIQVQEAYYLRSTEPKWENIIDTKNVLIHRIYGDYGSEGYLGY